MFSTVCVLAFIPLECLFFALESFPPCPASDLLIFDGSAQIPSFQLFCEVFTDTTTSWNSTSPFLFPYCTFYLPLKNLLQDPYVVNTFYCVCLSPIRLWFFSLRHGPFLSHHLMFYIVYNGDFSYRSLSVNVCWIENLYIQLLGIHCKDMLHKLLMYKRISRIIVSN